MEEDVSFGFHEPLFRSLVIMVFSQLLKRLSAFANVLCIPGGTLMPVHEIEVVYWRQAHMQKPNILICINLHPKEVKGYCIVDS